MWFGQWRENQETPFGFKWPKDPINSLGIFFSYDQTNADELNFGARLRELEQTLKARQKRKLSLHGKINIVETLGLSKLVDNTSVLSVPDHYIKQINYITFKFIWEGKLAKIKKSTIIAESKNGGLKMCDFSIMESALKIAWVDRIRDQTPASWKVIADHGVREYDNLAFSLTCNYNTNLLNLRAIYTVRFLLTTVACNFCSARCSRHAKSGKRHFIQYYLYLRLWYGFKT